jgi:transcriptional regulator with XRE-family HTH domain
MLRLDGGGQTMLLTRRRLSRPGKPDRRMDVARQTGAWRAIDGLVAWRPNAGGPYEALDRRTEDIRVMLIQKLRLQRGWSQEQLAELSGLSVRTIQRLERGQAASLESQKSLAAVFEIDLSRLQEPAMDAPRTTDVRPDEALALAHVRKVKGFYMHLVSYVVVMSGLIALNLATHPHYWWFVWPALGWGMGLAAHGMSVFNWFPFLDGAWEKRQVEKYLGRQL